MELEPLDTANPIVPGHALVEHRKIGVHQIEQTQVIAQQLLEKQVRLTDHRPPEKIIELGI
jgi:hypothetical protein